MIIKPGGIKGLTPDKKNKEREKIKQNSYRPGGGGDQGLRSGQAVKRRGGKK